MGDAWRRRTGFLMRVLAYRAAPPVVLIEMLPCGFLTRETSLRRQESNARTLSGKTRRLRRRIAPDLGHAHSVFAGAAL